MARLEDMLPPGEIVRWESPKAIRPKRLLGWGTAYVAASIMILAMIYAWTANAEAVVNLTFLLAVCGFLLLMFDVFLVLDSEAVVTEGHVVWANGTPLFGRKDGQVGLRDIRAVDLEEGRDAANLYSEGETHHIELVSGSDLEAMAQAIDRPARIWRKCTSPSAKRARRWQLYVGAAAFGLAAAGIIGLLFLAFGGDVLKGFWGAVRLLIAGLTAQWFGSIAERTLPHLLVGRTLVDEKERRDFVGWMIDLRWQGVKPDGLDDGRSPRSRLGEWAMRMAYGEIPDPGEREPEILVPGEFPPVS